MNLAKVNWTAIHRNKTVDGRQNWYRFWNRKPYLKIERATLLVIEFWKRKYVFWKQIVHVEVRPELVNKWNIMWRRRTQIDDQSGVVKERFWIIECQQEISPIHILRETGIVEEFNDYTECGRNPMTIGVIDLT